METATLALRVLVSLGAVLALIWWFQRRLTRDARNSGAEPLVKVVTRQAISPKASVVVVETGGQRFLLGVTEASVNVLHTSEAEEPATASFEDYLEAAGAGDKETGPKGTGDTTLVDPAGRHAPRRRSEGPAHALNGQPAHPVNGQPAHSGSPLAGSVLSPATWRQAAAAVRRGRNG